jgi:ABC-type spermidine/putrescine transport system permease subunit I
MMLGNLIELQFGQGRNWPLGAALSLTLLAIVVVALVFYVRNATREDGQMARRFSVRRLPGFAGHRDRRPS